MKTIKIIDIAPGKWIEFRSDQTFFAHGFDSLQAACDALGAIADLRLKGISK